MQAPNSKVGAPAVVGALVSVILLGTAWLVPDLPEAPLGLEAGLTTLLLFLVGYFKSERAGAGRV